MAMSNRERIGKMIDLLAPELEAFIHRAVGADAPEGRTWAELVQLRDERKGISGKTYAPEDPQVQLRFITEAIPNQIRRGWWPFKDLLTRVQESYVSELRDVRDAWAHGRSFQDDDAYRALDTAERFLKAIGAGKSAKDVMELRLGLRRVTAEKDDRRVIRESVLTPESGGLRPWREVLPPHHDVATGNFRAAEFAADLFQVSTNTEANDAYADPVEFFNRTYLTEGLSDLISRAVRRLAGDKNASAVVNLQTNFGGGKTHSMLALWHLAATADPVSFPQELQDLLAENGYEDIPGHVKRVALVGQHLAVSGASKDDGTWVNTIWGELAWQLGGREAYEIVRESDESGTAPGEALHTLLNRYGPAVILIDEWVAYARQLIDARNVAAGAFETQFTFAQALTEAVAATPGIFLAISIPASQDAQDAGHDEEVGGAHGQEALRRLQNVVRRNADQWQQASSQEAYQIVRQRLFVQPDAEALAEIRRVARTFGDMYRANATDFPSEARDAGYEERIRSTYPIHPELFDRLYEDWSTLERFQRTRGVLRLLNAVIHSLWVGEDASAMILPGSVPLIPGDVRSDLAQYLPDSWNAVIDADVDGAHAEPGRIDAERPLFGQRSLTKRLARAVFIGTAPRRGSAQRGIETQRVLLGVAVPGDVVGNFHSALSALGDRTTYFYSSTGKYWYDLQANITRQARDHAERLHQEDVWAEILKRLSGQARTRANFAGVHIGPEDHGDVPDTDEVRLVVMHPKFVHKRDDADSSGITFAREATERRGATSRKYRNMVVFLGADEKRMEELGAAVRDYLGWDEVVRNADTLDLTANQVSQARERRSQADTTAESRLLQAYTWGFVPEEPDPGTGFRIGTRRIDGSAPSLAERISRRLGNDGELNIQQAAATIRLQLDRIPALWADGHVSVGDLWEAFAQYPYLPRLRDEAVLIAGVTDQPLTWDMQGFALAQGVSDDGKYLGIWVPEGGQVASPDVTTRTLIVKPPLAKEQHRRDEDEAQRHKEETAPDSDNSEIIIPPTSGDDDLQRLAPHDHSDLEKEVLRRYFGVRSLRPERAGGDFKAVYDEVISHLVQPGADVSIRIEIEASRDDGFNEDVVRTVRENSIQLQFEQGGFERH